MDPETIIKSSPDPNNNLSNQVLHKAPKGFWRFLLPIFVLISAVTLFLINKNYKEIGLKKSDVHYKEQINSDQKEAALNSTKLKHPLILTQESKARIIVSALSPSSRRLSKLIDIPFSPNGSNDSQGAKPKIEIADNGLIAYAIEEGQEKSLYFWDGKTVRKRYSSRNPFDFLLSPSSDVIALSTYESTKDYMDVYRKFESSNKWEYVTRNFFYQLILADDHDPELILEKKLTDTDYDSISHYKIIDWSKLEQNTILLQVQSQGQLTGYTSGLYVLDLDNKEFGEKYPKIEQRLLSDRVFLNINSDETYLAYRAPDHACCGGINYNNDQTFVLDLKRGVETKVFDEYERFQNTEEEQKWTQQHQTLNLHFSPDNRLVAQTITSTKYADSKIKDEGELPSSTGSILISDIGGNELGVYENYILIGWNDVGQILAAKIANSAKNIWQSEDFESIDLIDLASGKISNLLSDSFMSVKLIQELSTGK